MKLITEFWRVKELITRPIYKILYDKKKIIRPIIAIIIQYFIIIINKLYLLNMVILRNIS